MNDGKILQYKKLFIEPEHHDYFMQAMRSLSSKEIMEVFRSFFWKEHWNDSSCHDLWHFNFHSLELITQ